MLEKNVKADCIRAIEEHLANLDFNGVFSNMGLVDRLQQVEGVKIVEVKSTTVKSAKFADPIPVDGRYIPDAGYFKAGELDLKMKIYGKV